MIGMNGSAAAIGEVAARDTAAELYRTSVQQVESVKEVVEHVTEMISEEDKFNAKKPILVQQVEAVNLFHENSEFETIVGKQKELVTLLQNVSERVRYMSEHTDGITFINIITSSTISLFLDARYWAELTEQETKVLVYYQTWLREVQHMQFMMYQMTPLIVATVLVLGVTGNGLLLTVFVRHKETRTLAFFMLINLNVLNAYRWF